MNLAIIFCAFLISSFHNLQSHIHEVNNVVSSIGITAYIAPQIKKLDEPCFQDDDCYGMMKCCIYEEQNFCCTPSGYVRLEPIYNTKE